MKPPGPDPGLWRGIVVALPLAIIFWVAVWWLATIIF